MSHPPPPDRPGGVHDEDDAVAAFRAARPRLVNIAYGLLGSLDEAEDVVQESWLRLRGAGPATISDVTGWLVVTVSRLACDVLRSARRRRESYVGPWLPEPLVGDDPADRVELDESLSIALLVVLEALSPAERTAFVLHDVFGMPFGEVSRAVRRSPAACRQLASRARRRVAVRSPRFRVSAAEQRRVASAFADACRRGEVAALLPLLDPDVEVRADGGGVVPAARHPIRGADRVARYLAGVVRRPGRSVVRAAVNGSPGVVWLRGDAVDAVLALAVADGRITAIDIVRNPLKLAHARVGRRKTDV